MATTDRQLYKTTNISGETTTVPASKRYRGISTVTPNKTSSLYDLQLIKQDIINHFHIRQGEKLENPTFGTIIWDILFEPLTEGLKDAIIQDVTNIINYDPRVTASDVLIDEYETGLQLTCQVTYLPYNISETLQLKFDQSLGLN
jgi:phage baseplate assembly protein W